MGTRICLAAALLLLSNIALAEPAVPLDSEATASQPPATGPSTVIAQAAPPSRTSTPTVNVTMPRELDVYLVETASREICDTFSFGGGDVRTECRTEPLPVRAENPALRGLCITRYGRRTCY